LYDNRHVTSFSEATAAIESLYSEVVSVLHDAATLFIPSTCKNACKFWWSCQLSQLKADSVNANRMWISALASHAQVQFFHIGSQLAALTGVSFVPIMQEYYKNYYSDALHDALMQKDGSSFWKCWRSKFNSHPVNFSVCGSVNNVFVCDKFYDHFCSIVAPNSPNMNSTLRNEFDRCYAEFIHHDCRVDDLFDIDVISDAISGLKRSKAVGPDGISAEHLHFSHPVVSSILLRLFNLIIFLQLCSDQFLFKLHRTFA
jgi:hypothetical protein